MNGEPTATTLTRLLDGNSPTAIRRAADLLRAGECVVFPTDTVYGVGVSAFDGPAVERLYAMKQRPFEKGIPILLADMADVRRVCRHLPPSALSLMERFWPGPLTLVVPRHPNLPDVISPNGTVAIRLPNNTIARDLIRAAGGAVATSSANISLQPPATSGLKAFESLAGLVAAIIDGGPSPGDQSSTIVDCSGAGLHILRHGPLSAADLGLTDSTGKVS